MRAVQEQPAQFEQLIKPEELSDVVQLVRIAFRVWSSREALALVRRLEQLAEHLQVEIPPASSRPMKIEFSR
jgi:hypothetical protein